MLDHDLIRQRLKQRARELVPVLRERVQVLPDARCERLRGVAVVVEMELDLAEAGTRELREPVEEVRAVLLAGEEPAVAWRPSVAVTKRGETWILLYPRIDARAADVVGSTAV